MTQVLGGNPNRRFDFQQLLQDNPYDPGVLTARDIIYIADMTVSFATQQGGLYVFDPADMSKLHPDMPALILNLTRLLNLALAVEKSSGGLSMPLVVATEDVHHEGHGSWAATYRDAANMMFQTITRAAVDTWTPDMIVGKAFTLDDLKRYLDYAGVFKTYTMEHGRAGTLDARVIDQIKNHPVTKQILPKGFKVSPLARMIAEQYALSRLAEGSSTGFTEFWVDQGYDRKFIAGLCGNICDAEEAIATAEITNGEMEVVFLTDGQLPLAVPAGPFDTTKNELEQLGLDPNYWIGLNPNSSDPLTLEQLKGAQMKALGVQFATIEMLANNMRRFLK